MFNSDTKNGLEMFMYYLRVILNGSDMYEAIASHS